MTALPIEAKRVSAGNLLNTHIAMIGVLVANAPKAGLTTPQNIVIHVSRLSQKGRHIGARTDPPCTKLMAFSCIRPTITALCA